MNLFDFSTQQTDTSNEVQQFRDLVSKWMTPERAKSIIVSKRQTKPQEPGFFEWAIKKTWEAFIGGGKRILEAGEWLATGKYNIAEAWLRGGAWALESVFSPITWTIWQTAETWFKALPTWFQQSIKETVTPVAQSAQEWYESQTPEQKRRLENIGVSAEVLLNFLWAKAAKTWIETTLKTWEKIGEKVAKTKWVITEQAGKAVETTKDVLSKKGTDFLYEAVNPTTRENKAILKQRVEELVPYIDNNPIKNSLEDVKSRIDIDKQSALDNMKNYETKVWVKWSVDVAPIQAKLKNDFMKTTSKGVLVDEDTAAIAQQMIKKLDELGPTIKDKDIILLRRAWDDIIEKNRGFMLTGEAKTKWEIFDSANKFLREEIRKSNPDYAKFLEKYHKSTTLSDVIGATILRRAWQTKWWFIKRWLENVWRVTGATVWWIPWYLAAEALIQGWELASWAGAKLTAGKLLYKKAKNGISRNVTNSTTNNLPNKQGGLITKPKPNEQIKPQSTTSITKSEGSKFNPLDLSKNKKWFINNPLSKEIEPSVLQWKDKDWNIYFKTINKWELSKYNVDDMWIAGKNIDGKVYHLTAKTPEQMEKAGAKFKWVAKEWDIPSKTMESVNIWNKYEKEIIKIEWKKFSWFPIEVDWKKVWWVAYSKYKGRDDINILNIDKIQIFPEFNGNNYAMKTIDNILLKNPDIDMITLSAAKTAEPIWEKLWFKYKDHITKEWKLYGLSREEFYKKYLKKQ